MHKLISIFFTSILLLSCETNKSKSTENQEIDLRGNWEYLGFGKAISINDSIVKGFHISSVGNVPLSDNNLSDYFEYYTVDTLSNDTILLKDGVKTFKLFRSDKDFEKDIHEDLSNDPNYNFEVLWHTFNEQYCYFKERSIDWKALYNNYAPQVQSNMEPLPLFLLFEKMLGEIQDGHISIDVPDELEEAYENQTADNGKESNEDIPEGLEKRVKDRIVEKHLKTFGRFNQGELKWGMVDTHVAYMQTSNMISWAHYPIADSLSKDQFWSEWWKKLNQAKNHHDDVAEGTRFIMDSIVRTVADAKAFIIDLRFNGGGFDDASVEILNHFIHNKTEIGTKKVKLGGGFTEKQSIMLTPSERPFKGKLFILTSHETASAAELLVLGSKELPNAKIIGGTTEGVFSDILRKKLPNGWKYGLSNMIYESVDGVSYEEVGISPDITLDYPVRSKDFYEYLLEDVKDGDDAILKVIDEINGD
ncbi:S41 family peptidase [Aggregatimonas sangjinii]|uniref:S41 family peptidase n=1 Tax=Aggregatimonas sangjinii TaxID=2583587 RepID=A0A5B7SXD3_9FLAO|nr:S41 family peptidase [Aggregatimonas sangjinii]QCX01424.1 S41 family peptidase [Aggregatimonas sangjinii]